MRTAKSQKSRLSLVALAPADVRKLPKAHKGFDSFAADLVALFKANPVALPATGLDFDELLANVSAYQSLAQPESDAHKQLVALQTTRIVRSSAAWQTMLEMYARAITAGRTNAAVRAGIADFVAFMKHARKKKAASATPVAA